MSQTVRWGRQVPPGILRPQNRCGRQVGEDLPLEIAVPIYEQREGVVHVGGPRGTEKRPKQGRGLVTDLSLVAEGGVCDLFVQPLLGLFLFSSNPWMNEHPPKPQSQKKSNYPRDDLFGTGIGRPRNGQLGG